MRRTFAALAFTGLLAFAAASFTILPSGGQVNAAPSTATFMVPAHDGYGIAECLSSNTDCAKVDRRFLVRVARVRPCGALRLACRGRERVGPDRVLRATRAPIRNHLRTIIQGLRTALAAAVSLHKPAIRSPSRRIGGPARRPRA